MMASARDVRYHLKPVLEAVERGEEVVITKRGAIKARIVPVKSDSEPSAVNSPFVGMWKDRRDMKDVRRYVRRIREFRP